MALVFTLAQITKFIFYSILFTNTWACIILFDFEKKIFPLIQILQRNLLPQLL